MALLLDSRRQVWDASSAARRCAFDDYLTLDEKRKEKARSWKDITLHKSDDGFALEHRTSFWRCRAD